MPVCWGEGDKVFLVILPCESVDKRTLVERILSPCFSTDWTWIEGAVGIIVPSGKDWIISICANNRSEDEVDFLDLIPSWLNSISSTNFPFWVTLNKRDDGFSLPVRSFSFSKEIWEELDEGEWLGGCGGWE